MTTAIAKSSIDTAASRVALDGISANSEMSIAAIVDRKRKIAEVMDAVMKDGEHYGTIPGCGPKPTLLKAGAEVLATTFNLAPTFKISRTDLPHGHREYEIVCTLTHVSTGAVLGEGVGCCSTMESKYRWRKGQRVCPTCQQPAILKSKYEAGGWYCFDKKGGCGAKFPDGSKDIEQQETGRIENPDIADVYNTVLKIAKKRAQVDCTLTAVGASDLLTQDLEDLPHGTVRDDFADDRDKSAPTRPSPRPPASSRTRHGLSMDDELEAHTIGLIDQMERSTNLLELQELEEEGNRLPKGTRARHAAWAAYQTRKGQLSH